jgi:hypothetical protein
LQQTRAGKEEQDNPGQTCQHAQTRVEKFRGAEAEQDGGEKIRGRADE